MAGRPRVRINERLLYQAIGAQPQVHHFMKEMGRRAVIAMNSGNRVSRRVEKETFYRFYPDVGGRPVVVVTAGRDTGRGRFDSGFFSVFLELGTKKMPKKTNMTRSVRSLMRFYGIYFGMKRVVKGSVQWHS